jgi:hypothetical protein
VNNPHVETKQSDASESLIPGNFGCMNPPANPTEPLDLKGGGGGSRRWHSVNQDKPDACARMAALADQTAAVYSDPRRFAVALITLRGLDCERSRGGHRDKRKHSVLAISVESRQPLLYATSRMRLKTLIGDYALRKYLDLQEDRAQTPTRIVGTITSWF